MSLRAIHQSNPSTSSLQDPTHIYKQIQVYNNNTAFQAPSVPCVFSQVQLSSVVDDASQYYASIVRWSAQSTLPQIIPDMVVRPGGTPLAYSGDTNYYVAIIKIANAADADKPSKDCFADRVIYNPPVNRTNGYSIPFHTPASQALVYQDPYYYINNISEFLDLLNVSLATCATYCNVNLGPKFNYNSNTGKIELLANNAEFGPGSAGQLPTYAVCVNQQLFNIMASFHVSLRPDILGIYSTSGIPLYSSWYMFAANDDLGRSAFVNQDAEGKSSVIDVIQQTNTSIPSMSPVDSIQMETATIPVQNTLVGAPSFLGPTISNASGSANNVAVLTSYQAGLITGTEYSQGFIQYSPTTELRLIDMTSNGNVQNLQISVVWLDKLGQTHPLLLPNGQGASMLLLFRKKSFNGLP
jgi:hypothetical protein